MKAPAIDQTLTGRRAFILENTRVQAPPHTPELVLHLADEVTPIWRLTEEALAEIGLPPPFWAFAWAGGQALARYVLDHPEVVAGKRVIDFASGSGLVAIAAMRGGDRGERGGQRRGGRLHRGEPAGRPTADG
jgi:predicted nicotinamide N-methyase